MDIDLEIAKHLEWIESVVSLIDQEAVSKEDVEAVSKHDRCDLGRWLDSKGSARYQRFPEFGELKQSHQAFHTLAAELIRAVSDGNEDQAFALQEQFVATSQEVIGYLSALREHSENDSAGPAEG